MLKLTWQQIRQLNFFSHMENLVSNGLEGSKTVILTCIRVECNMSVCSKYTENMVMLTKIVIKRNMEKLLSSSDEFRGWTGERVYLFLPRSIDIRNFQVWTMKKSLFKSSKKQFFGYCNYTMEWFKIEQSIQSGICCEYVISGAQSTILLWCA